MNDVIRRNGLPAEDAPRRQRAAGGVVRVISIVVPCLDEEGLLSELYCRLSDLADILAEQAECETELVLVDDGSRDATWTGICELAQRDCRVRGLRLSRNFGHQAALICGYEHARGDAVVSLDADLQDPPEVVPEMVQRWREGADVVFGVRESRAGESWFKRGTAWLFYWLMHKLGARHVRRNVGDFRLLSRRALDALLRLPERQLFFRDAVGWIGFHSAEVRYDRQARLSGESKFTLGRMCRLASGALISSSATPLYFSWCAAALVAALVMGFGIAALWSLREGQMLPAVITVLCAWLILIGQGIQGLYLARIYEECRGRPRYLVADRAPGPSDWQLPPPAGVAGWRSEGRVTP